MKELETTISTINDSLDQLLRGRPLKAPLEEAEFPEDFKETVDRINRLSGEIAEMNGFLLELTRGNLDSDPPSRHNMLSGPIKEIHSQLTSLCTSLEMLIGGQMVSKLYYPGRLYELYNQLIDRVSKTLGNLDIDSDDWANPNSWRFHQVLGAINKLSVMIFELAEDGSIVYANPKAKELLSDHKLEGMPYDSPDDCGALLSYLCTFHKPDEELTYPVLFEMHDYKNDVWYKITTDRVQLTDGEMGLLHFIDDITEFKRNEIKLRQSVMIDSLTGAYSRFAGMQKLDEVVRNNSVNQINCVAFLDLDGLKEINDKYGHGMGDQALTDMATVLRRSVRETDWVVRYGGDEFLLILLDCELDATEHVFARMERSLEHINSTGNKPYTLSFSMGVMEIGLDVTNVEEIIDQVDQIMYENKRKKHESQ